MLNYYMHLKKTMLDQKYILILLTVFCFLFEYLFAWVFFESEISPIVAAFMQRLPPAFLAFLGVQGGTSQFATQLLAFGYMHPVIIISLAFLQVSIPARYIAGEIELKTFDLLLTKPIKRFVIPFSVFSFLIISLGLQFAAMFLGTLAGGVYFDLQINSVDYGKAAFVGFIFFLSMGSIALAISVFQNEKGKALSKAIGVLVVLYFFDTIIKLSKSLENLSTYSYFQLYQPGKLVLNQADAKNCILISVVIIAVFLSVTVIQFNRRDL
ncbi:MAG: ABC transporter permease [Proteobacteria bacterium]|nr:ABC transporter permease [Pseudomonadota bacterium]MBU1583480.1 ABC transporter permease [Pseudomonadota bacterium]MBU2454192.1 ABC transporter permease [Pseudomonadota bacterium]MBU2627778.1 ABC transporter permease [Pseudomonadota bacterium]